MASPTLKGALEVVIHQHSILVLLSHKKASVTLIVGIVVEYCLASSGICQETETCMVRACHTPRPPLQRHPSGHLGAKP